MELCTQGRHGLGCSAVALWCVLWCPKAADTGGSGGLGEELLTAAIQLCGVGSEFPPPGRWPPSPSSWSGYIRASAAGVSRCALPHLRPPERWRTTLPAAIGGRYQCRSLLPPTDGRTFTSLDPSVLQAARCAPSNRLAELQRHWRTCKHAYAALSHRMVDLFYL